MSISISSPFLLLICDWLAPGLGPPVDVSWGEGTADEMCLAGLQTVNHLRAVP